MAIEDQDQGDMIRVPLGQTVIIPRQRYDQLQADLAALKAYALRCEQRWSADEIASNRREFGVAEILVGESKTP